MNVIWYGFILSWRLGLRVIGISLVKSLLCSVLKKLWYCLRLGGSILNGLVGIKLVRGLWVGFVIIIWGCFWLEMLVIFIYLRLCRVWIFLCMMCGIWCGSWIWCWEGWWSRCFWLVMRRREGRLCWIWLILIMSMWIKL